MSITSTLAASLATVSLLLSCAVSRAEAAEAFAPALGTLAVLPEAGRAIYVQAIDRARREIKIEICVLEDPKILKRLQAALERGVRVRAIVDRGKYEALPAERDHLAQYLTSSGGELHLSNPIFPRSFGKVVLVDEYLLVYGSACLDQTTFAQYRDFALATLDPVAVRDLHRVFDTDWAHSAPPGQDPPPFNPTPRLTPVGNLIVGPVNGADRLVRLYQDAERTLDLYTELLGNPTLESELVAAVNRGVRVRLIAPREPNGVTPEERELQLASLTALSGAGVDVRVSGPEQTAALPYMHARAAIVDGRLAYLGSLSLSRDSTTFNREVGMTLRDPSVVRQLSAQFESDFLSRTQPY